STSPEAVTTLHFDPLYLSQVTWSNPASNRLLLDAGVSYSFNAKKTGIDERVTAASVAITDTGIGKTYGAFATNGSTADNATPRGQEGNQMNGRLAASYGSGAHAVKAGFVFYPRWDRQEP